MEQAEGYAARLALVIHLVRWAAEDSTLASPDAVDEKSIECGVALARWFGHEDQRIYAMLDESEEAREQRELIELIERRGGRITARELMHASRKYRQAAEGATDVLDALVKCRRGRWVLDDHGRQGGRPVDVFELHEVVTVTQPSDSPEKAGVVLPQPTEPAQDEGDSEDGQECEWMG